MKPGAIQGHPRGLRADVGAEARRIRTDEDRGFTSPDRGGSSSRRRLTTLSTSRSGPFGWEVLRVPHREKCSQQPGQRNGGPQMTWIGGE